MFRVLEKVLYVDLPSYLVLWFSGLLQGFSCLNHLYFFVKQTQICVLVLVAINKVNIKSTKRLKINQTVLRMNFIPTNFCPSLSGTQRQ